jgi:hypothetical protein
MIVIIVCILVLALVIGLVAGSYASPPRGKTIHDLLEERNDMNSLDLYTILDEALGRPGRMLSGSKTANPEREIVWNANLFMEVPGIVRTDKVWYGDLSLADSREALQKMANEMQATFYVLREGDGRFDREKDPALDRAVAKFEPKA